MKLYAPKYYEKFKCIADKCNHSCCIGWEIDIDSSTLQKYSSLSGEASATLLESIDMCDCPKFKMSDDRRCCNLDENGLCKLIKSLGEEYLCDICREHPRFYNFTNRGKEVGLGMSCEEACRLILSSDDFDQMIEISEVDGEADVCDFDAISKIDEIYTYIKSGALDIISKISMMYDVYDIEVEFEQMKEILEGLEYLNPENREIFLSYTDSETTSDIDKELTRAFAYFIYRHCSEACDYEDFCTSLSFAVFCTKLIKGISNGDDIYEKARIVSEEIEYSEENIEKIKSNFYGSWSDLDWS